MVPSLRSAYSYPARTPSPSTPASKTGLFKPHHRSNTICGWPRSCKRTRRSGDGVAELPAELQVGDVGHSQVDDQQGDGDGEDGVPEEQDPDVHDLRGQRHQEAGVVVRRLAVGAVPATVANSAAVSGSWGSGLMAGCCRRPGSPPAGRRGGWGRSAPRGQGVGRPRVDPGPGGCGPRSGMLTAWSWA
jgi:hypothetical protein